MRQRAAAASPGELDGRRRVGVAVDQQHRKVEFGELRSVVGVGPSAGSRAGSRRVRQQSIHRSVDHLRAPRCGVRRTGGALSIHHFAATSAFQLGEHGVRASPRGHRRGLSAVSTTSSSWPAPSTARFTRAVPCSARWRAISPHPRECPPASHRRGSRRSISRPGRRPADPPSTHRRRPRVSDARDGHRLRTEAVVHQALDHLVPLARVRVPRWVRRRPVRIRSSV